MFILWQQLLCDLLRWIKEEEEENLLINCRLPLNACLLKPMKDADNTVMLSNNHKMIFMLEHFKWKGFLGIWMEYPRKVYKCFCQQHTVQAYSIV